MPRSKKEWTVKQALKVYLGTIMKIKRKVLRNPTIIAKNLKKNIPQLANVSVLMI